MQGDNKGSPIFWQVWWCFPKSVSCISAGSSPTSQGGWATQNREILAAEHLHCGPTAAGWAASLFLWCCMHNDFTMTHSTEKHCFCYRWFSLPALQMGGLCRAGFWLCSAWGFFCLATISSSYWESRNAFFGWGRDTCKSSSPESWFFRYCPRTKSLLKKIWKLIV